MPVCVRAFVRMISVCSEACANTMQKTTASHTKLPHYTTQHNTNNTTPHHTTSRHVTPHHIMDHPQAPCWRPSPRKGRHRPHNFCKILKNHRHHPQQQTLLPSPRHLPPPPLPRLYPSVPVRLRPQVEAWGRMLLLLHRRPRLLHTQRLTKTKLDSPLMSIVSHHL